MDEQEPIGTKLARVADPTTLLENLFVHAPVPFSVFGSAGRCLMVNRAFMEVFGAAPPADYNLFEDDAFATAGQADSVTRAFAGETITLPPIWHELRRSEGAKLGPAASARGPGKVAIAVTLFPLRDARGAVQHVGICYRDVTAEIELRDSSAQRERTHLELVRLEAQSRQMQEAARLKSEFLANMSHELRTPLNAILGFAELIAEGVVVPGSPQHAEFVGHILGSGRQLLRLINDVLDLTKVEAGRMHFFPEHVALEPLAQEVCGVLKAANRQRNLDIVCQCDPALGEIVIDPTRFKQVLFNYLSNAIKFSPAGGHIEVRLRPENAAEFRLEVIDDGIGIAAEQRARLFVEFQQLEPGSAKRHGGTGLGLALTKRMVEALGGSVGVESELGHGSTFFAILPRRAPLQRQRSLTPSRLNSTFPAVAPCAPAPAPRVLVIDDDLASLRLMETALEQLGYQAIGADNGERGLSLAEQMKPECIVLDLMLPGADGFEILAKLRADPKQKETPVIVWTMKDLSSAETSRWRRGRRRSDQRRRRPLLAHRAALDRFAKTSRVTYIRSHERQATPRHAVRRRSQGSRSRGAALRREQRGGAEQGARARGRAGAWSRRPAGEPGPPESGSRTCAPRCKVRAWPARCCASSTTRRRRCGSPPARRCATSPMIVTPRWRAQWSRRSTNAWPAQRCPRCPGILAEIGEPSALPLIGRCLRHPDPEVIASGIEALAELGDPEAVPLLEPLTKDQRVVELSEGDGSYSTSLAELASEAITELER